MFQNCCNLFKVYPHIAWTNHAHEAVNTTAPDFREDILMKG